jgi:hypothetical protein
MPDPEELHADLGEGEGLGIVDPYDRILFRCRAAAEHVEKFHDVCNQMELFLAPAYTRWMRRIRGPGDIFPVVLSDLLLWEEDGGFRDVVPGGDRNKACKAILETIDDLHSDIWKRLRPSLLEIIDTRMVLEDYRQRARDAMELTMKTIHVINAVRCILQAHADILHQTTGSPMIFPDRNATAYGAYVCQAVPPMDPSQPGNDERARLFTYAFARVRQRGLRKRRGVDRLYEEVIMPNRQRTYTYEPLKKTVEELVYDIFKREGSVGGSMWSALTRGGTVSDMVKYLDKCFDTDLPDLNAVETLMAFDDGMYCMRTDTFAEWDDVEEVFREDLENGTAYRYFAGVRMGPVYNRDADDDEDAMETDVAGAFWKKPDDLDTMFDDPGPDHDERVRRPLYEIDLGPLLKVCRDQEFTDRTIFLLLASIGRLMFPARSIDHGQWWPVFLGVGGSGKSTVMDLIKEVVHAVDIFNVSADSEERFGRERIVSSRFVMIPDLRGDRMGMSSEFFLAAAAGDAVTIPVKYGTPIAVPSFDKQGIIASNQLPKSWLDDASGAMARRMLVFPFKRAISPRDPSLRKRMLDHHLAHFIRAISLAYLMLPKDIEPNDTPLTDEMATARMSLLRSSNSLIDYLSSTSVSKGVGLTFHMDEMEEEWRKHVREQRPGDRTQWTMEYAEHALRMCGLELVQHNEGVFARGVAKNSQ